MTMKTESGNDIDNNCGHSKSRLMLLELFHLQSAVIRNTIRPGQSCYTPKRLLKMTFLSSMKSHQHFVQKQNLKMSLPE